MIMNRVFSVVVFLLGCTLARVGIAAAPAAKAEENKGPVSYYKQIRPIFQAQCQGCHQPAKAQGGYVMTDFARMLAGGDSKSKSPAVVAGKPEQSLLFTMLVPNKDGEVEMPKGKPALPVSEVALIRKWLTEGAHDDTPVNARQRYDQDHLPVYTRQPVVTSLDFSPDGKLLALAGFHEVLLHRADGSGVVARLVGLSERIESVRFSPDGKSLAVAGGQPGRMGEVQIWDVEKRKLKLSLPVTYDTVYGVSWSPDGATVAFGCADNTVRAINAQTGKQILQQGSHSDWVLDTAFSVDGGHLVSVGRDMTTKLTEVATQRFVDNVTSITPGALRGGIHSIERHPEQDNILVGGSDGAPQIFRIFRQTARQIGDNANLIRKFPELPGRIFSARYSRDGKKFAAASSLDNSGQVVIYAADVDAKIPDNIKKIMEKRFSAQTPAERVELEKFQTAGTKLVAQTDVPTAGVYAVAFSPDGKLVAAAGQDGVIRWIDAASGKVTKSTPAAPVVVAAAKNEPAAATPAALRPAGNLYSLNPADQEVLPKGAQVVSLDVYPKTVKLGRSTEYNQLVVSARLASGDTADVTRMVNFSLDRKVADITPRGHLHPIANGKTQLKITLGDKSVTLPVEVAGIGGDLKVDFIRDVNPVLSKLGCNAGTCHGAKDGKNGFKLSLRGYDPIYDVRAFIDDLAARRVNFASPDDSLMLLKSTGAVPHEGGQRTRTDEKYYQVLRAWIADGAKLTLDAPRVTRIEIVPQNPVVQTVGARQQTRVVAFFSNGDSRDVTAEAFTESGNTDVAVDEGGGLLKVLRRGEAPVLVRYEGAYAATTITVMGDRTGFAWKDQPAHNRIDELVAAKWKRMKTLPSELCSDADFIRRVYLDLTGLPPAAGEVREFLADSRATRVKRDALIDKLVGSPDYVDHWANKWADLLQVNRKFLGAEGAQLFREWIRKEIEANTPYDQFVKKIVTASGSNREHPQASYFKVLRTPTETMENTTHLFLATRFNCNKCHDHPFERWTQDQYYQMTAFFAQVELKKDPESKDKNIGGTAVEGAKPLYEIISDKADGDIKHDRTGKVAPPDFPYPAKFEVKKEKPSRREKLAEWLVSSDNRYFASSYVNRLWGYLLGVGIIEPLDDIRAGNPPTNPELLEFLTQEFVKSNFNVRQLIQLICKSRTYQLALATHKWNEDDKINYSHALARRLPAEVLYDAVLRVTGASPNFPGVKPGTRAAQLPDSAIDVPSGFLANLGRPPRESACECERSNEIRLGSVMSLLTGPAVADAIGDTNNAVAKLVAAEKDDRKVVQELYLRVLSRPATDKEIEKVLKTAQAIDQDHQQLAASLEASEKHHAPDIARREKQRLEAIAAAEKTLAAYEKERAPINAANEKKRLDKIAADEKALKESEAALPTRLLDWEKTLPVSRTWTAWTQLVLADPKATGGPKLVAQKDGSLLASGPGANVDYTFKADTKLTNITGVMIEVLPDTSLPDFGPGRNKGNFVLTELTLNWGRAGKADEKNAVTFADARADFSQKDFDVKLAIDGKNEANGKGWAVSGTPTGQPHFATFQLAKPIAATNATELRFTLSQKFGEGFTIGRFRVWVTTSADPLNFGLPASVAETVKLPPQLRTKDQVAALTNYYRATDMDLRKKEQTLFVSKQPLPADPKLAELKGAVTTANEPIKLDPKLVQLRLDTAMSVRQLTDKRLTMAQDLAWALINNPAFLFNR